MFLDGMGDQLSGLERDEAGGCDHAEGDPLDGIEEIAEWDRIGERLTEEGEKVLGYSGGDQGGGEWCLRRGGAGRGSGGGRG